MTMSPSCLRGMQSMKTMHWHLSPINLSIGAVCPSLPPIGSIEDIELEAFPIHAVFIYEAEEDVLMCNLKREHAFLCHLIPPCVVVANDERLCHRQVGCRCAAPSGACRDEPATPGAGACKTCPTSWAGPRKRVPSLGQVRSEERRVGK